MREQENTRKNSRGQERTGENRRGKERTRENISEDKKEQEKTGEKKRAEENMRGRERILFSHVLSCSLRPFLIYYIRGQERTREDRRKGKGRREHERT